MPLFLWPREWRPTGQGVFPAFMSYPTRGFAYLIRNTFRLLIEQIQVTVFSNRFVRDLICTGKIWQEALLAQKKFQKIPKKKATNKHNLMAAIRN